MAEQNLYTWQWISQHTDPELETALATEGNQVIKTLMEELVREPQAASLNLACRVISCIQKERAIINLEHFFNTLTEKGVWPEYLINRIDKEDQDLSFYLIKNPLKTVLQLANVDRSSQALLCQALCQTIKKGNTKISLELLKHIQSIPKDLACSFVEISSGNHISIREIPILQAAFNLGNEDLLLEILGKGASVKTDNGHPSIIEMAIERNFFRLVHQLFIPNPKYPGLLFSAIMGGYKPAIQAKILQNKEELLLIDLEGNSPLHIAAQTGNLAAIGLLLNNGALTEAKNKKEQTPLMLACRCNQREAAELLCARGANALVKDENECTCLHYACAKGNLPLAESLLAQHASLNVRDKTGSTPLHAAAVANHPELISTLMQKGARLERDNAGRTPIEKAFLMGSFQAILAFYELNYLGDLAALKARVLAELPHNKKLLHSRDLLSFAVQHGWQDVLSQCQESWEKAA